MEKSIFVSAEWLNDHLNDPEIILLDGSWHIPTSQRNALQEYQNAHIPNALFFDIDALSDLTSPYPHMLLSPLNFAQKMGEMGISDQHKIVIYDHSPLFSSARVRYMLKIYGAKSVYILEGGLKAWQDAGFDLTDEITPQRSKTIFHPSFQNSAVIDYEGILRHIQKQDSLILDARSEGRFSGEAAEPREGLSSGHMPHAKNLPFQKLLNEKGGLKNKQELRNIFEESGLQENQKIITSCGSGVTAAVLALGLEVINHPHYSLYDGSWTEYASKSESIIEKTI